MHRASGTSVSRPGSFSIDGSNTGQYLGERHGIPRELLGNVTGIGTIIAEAGD